MSKNNHINIFIVEDNESYAKSLQIFIQNNVQNVSGIKIFNFGELCLMGLSLCKTPDIIIMDYFLNSKFKNAQNGLEIIKQIKTQNPLIKIIVISSQDKYQVIFEAIRKYDCYYVQKDEETFKKIEHLINNFNHKNNLNLEPKSA